MTGFTKGPWKAEEGVASAGNCLAVVQADWDGVSQTKAVCLISPADAVEAKDIANARLTAAAPDLYEAVAAYLAAYDGATGTVYIEPMMRAALAKARGE